MKPLGLFISILFAFSTASHSQSLETQSLETQSLETQSLENGLAKTILADQDFPLVLRKAKQLAATGFNAGEGYGEVWIRDLATFIELSCQAYDHDEIKKRLLLFFHFQGDDGNIIDGYVPKDQAGIGYEYIKSKTAPDFLGHKNTVETDQETSLVHAISRYIASTNDHSILQETINGKTVLHRLEWALAFLLNHRFDKTHGLLWGATTADWGDVQPEHEWGVVLDENSHPAIDIYDNAMMVLALNQFLEMVKSDTAKHDQWKATRDSIQQNIRTHLWDDQNKKYIPHIYLKGSPFPKDFQENEIYYHGGTAMAILAGLLAKEEIKASLEIMRDNAKRSGAATIGLTLYPPYPAGFFKNPSMAKEYSYQNGGDWTWFGGRMIHALIENGMMQEAYDELKPMVGRVVKNDGFYEWYSIDNQPRGSGSYRGSAGVLAKAIEALTAWAEEKSESSN